MQNEEQDKNRERQKRTTHIVLLHNKVLNIFLSQNIFVNIKEQNHKLLNLLITNTRVGKRNKREFKLNLQNLFTDLKCNM